MNQSVLTVVLCITIITQKFISQEEIKKIKQLY